MKKFTRVYKIYLAVGFALVALVLGGTFLLFRNILSSLGPALGP